MNICHFRTQRLLGEDEWIRAAINISTMDYVKPIVLAQSAIMMADCTKKPCGRPTCTKKPSGSH